LLYHRLQAVALTKSSSRRFAVVELVIGSGISAFLALCYIIYTGRVLGPIEYADVSAALAVLYFFSIAVGPVMPTIARFTAMFAQRNDTARIVALHDALLRGVYRWAAPAALLAAIFTFPLQVALHFRSPVTVVLTIACIAVFVSLSVDRGVVQGLARFHDYSVNVVTETAIRLAGAVTLLAFTRNAAVALVSYLAGLLIANLLLRLQLRRGWRDVTPEAVDLGEVMRFARPMLLLMVAFAILQNADMLAAKRWLPAALAGSYGAAAGLARTFGVINVPFFILIVPRITALYESGQPIAATALRICGWYLLLSLGPLSTFGYFAGPIIRYAFGPQFGEAAGILLPLSFLAIASNLGLLIAQAFASAHRFWILRVYLTGAIVEVVVLLLAHETAQMIIRSVLTLQVIVVGIMAAVLVVSERRVVHRLSSP
jgi:O-antigen/teichoic acid export membrane protein